MKTTLSCAMLALAAVVGPANAAGLTGKYVEARTCDVWTGPCYANADMNLTGKHAVLGWTIDAGKVDGVKLDGLSVVAIVAASDTLGLAQTGTAKAVLLVDKKATKEQRAALVAHAKKQGGELVANVVKVIDAKISLDVCECKGGGCAVLDAGCVKIKTACLTADHKVCGNESAFFPPLAKGVKVTPALAEAHEYTGKDIGATWSDAGRRGAYLGTFETR